MGMEGLVKMNIAFKLPNQPKPFAVDVESNYLVRRPANAWDLKDMMVEDLTSRVYTKVKMGLMDGEKEVIAVDMIAKRTEELKQIVSLTEEFKQCEQMITKGEKLSLVCKKARSLAAILDLLEMNVALPKTIVNNNYVRTLLDVVKASLLPYLSVEPSTYNLRTESHELAKIQMRIDSMGKLVTLVVDANEQKTIAKNLRYSLPLPMLPIQVRESALVHAIERVTQYGLPTTCAIEMGQKICISKQQIKVCGSQGSPKGIMQQREVELFCLPKDREGMTMRQMAESGDKIERASSYPTESVALIYEPEMC